MLKVSYCNQTQTMILEAADETITRFPMKNLMVAPITPIIATFNKGIHAVLQHEDVFIEENDGVLHFKPTEFSISKNRLEKIIECYSYNQTKELFDLINVDP